MAIWGSGARWPRRERCGLRQRSTCGKPVSSGRRCLMVEGSMMPKVISIAALLALLITPSTASANPQDEVRAAFDQFVVAQNAHDIAAVGALLLDSPSFLWITRGTPIWGHAAALQRFESLYKGTWRLE